MLDEVPVLGRELIEHRLVGGEVGQLHLGHEVVAARHVDRMHDPFVVDQRALELRDRIEWSAACELQAKDDAEPAGDGSDEPGHRENLR